MLKVLLPGTKKRQEPPELLEGLNRKKPKLDYHIKVECGKILKTLMLHKYGYVFNQPVDPVALGIPDYFTVISHPMDFGTISKKLDDDIYSNTEAFAADVRLTFSNAMTYNPPGNFYHLLAIEMNDIFVKSWRSLEAKLVKQSKKVSEQSKLKKNIQNTNKIQKTVKQQGVGVGAGLKVRKTEDTSDVTSCSERKPSISCDEKARLKKELLVALRGDLSGPLRGFLRKYGLISSKKEKIESVFDTFGDHTLLELKRVMKGCLVTSIEKVNNMTSCFFYVLLYVYSV